MVIATAMAAGVMVEVMGATEATAAVMTTRWVTLAGASEPWTGAPLSWNALKKTFMSRIRESLVSLTER